MFTALREMQGGLGHERNVCPSVWQTRGLWQNKTFCPDFYTIWKNAYPGF